MILKKKEAHLGFFFRGGFDDSYVLLLLVEKTRCDYKPARSNKSNSSITSFEELNKSDTASVVWDKGVTLIVMQSVSGNTEIVSELVPRR